MHAGAIRYAREADRLPFSRQAKQSRTYKPSDALSAATLLHFFLLRSSFREGQLLDRLNPTIAELNQAVDQEVERCPAAQRLMTHPGVGPLTALAFILIIGE